MYDFEIVNDNGMIDVITCDTRTKAIETYCSIHGYSKEYVKEHCIIRKTFLSRSAEWSKKKGGAE